MHSDFLLRAAQPGDAAAILRILEPIVRAGETYALPRDMTAEAILEYWTSPGREVFVAEAEGAVAGTYFITPNQRGGGSHVANCGYATASESAGRGVARAMCSHSLDYARQRGYRAMQFNFVVSTNERAVRLWQSFGFATLARLPQAFQHPVHGLVDALVMHRFL
jgi:L-amino acid N-acyltransferase YncA